MKRTITISLLLFIFGFLLHSNELEIKLSKIATVGQSDPVFSVVIEVCEDKERDFYVLDRKAVKIHKFSPEGNFLFSFGKLGEGPGDMTRPKSIYYSLSDTIIVTEFTGIVSEFNCQGRFIRKFNLNNKVGYISMVGYAGKDRYYGEKNNKDIPTQLIMNSKGKIINKELFSTLDNKIESRNKKNITTFSFSMPIFTPRLIFNYYGGYSIAANSRNYHIKILDSQGKVKAEIKRDLPRMKITPGEKKKIEAIIDKNNSAPYLRKVVKKSIPETKNFIQDIMLNEKYAFIFKIHEDSNTMISTADIYSLSGKYKGTANLLLKPKLITSEFMYFLLPNRQGNPILLKFKYSIHKKE